MFGQNLVGNRSASYRASLDGFFNQMLAPNSQCRCSFQSHQSRQYMHTLPVDQGGIMLDY
eukprot:3261908-Amphidinium_carterae.1